MEKIKFPKDTTEYKLTVKGSKFIGTVFCAKTESEALSLLEKTRKKYFDATHNCYAYLIQNGTFKFSDDGEPSGSAGKPIFNVLKGSGLTNTLIIVTRYFGGTKLGVGGLVRAYSDCAKKVLELVETVELEEVVTVKTKLNFNEAQYIYHLADKLDKIKIEEENYSANGVIFSLKIGKDNYNLFKQKLTEKLNRNQQIDILEEKFDKI
jgi:uncharacterized YigZ family protein